MTNKSQDQGKPAVRLPIQDPQILAEIDRLDQVSKASPGEVGPQIALWEAVASLSYWVCINRGTPKEPRPFMLAGQSGPILCIFTSPHRAKEAALATGIITEGESITLFAPPLPGALDWAMTFAKHGITGVTVDYPRIGALAPLSSLTRLKQSRV